MPSGHTSRYRARETSDVTTGLPQCLIFFMPSESFAELPVDYGHSIRGIPATVARVIPRIGSAASAIGTGAALYSLSQNLHTRYKTGGDWPFNSRWGAFISAAPTIGKWGSALRRTWYHGRNALGYTRSSSYTPRARPLPMRFGWPGPSQSSRRSYRPSYRRRKYPYRKRRFY